MKGDRGHRPALPALVVLLLISAMVASISGCTRESQAAQPATDRRIELAVEPKPPSVGDSQLVITLLSPEGAPLEGADVSARGDMNHAGMVPVFGEAEEAAPGQYRIPFEWTMAGDWIVTIEAELPNGQRIERSFDVRVHSEES